MYRMMCNSLRNYASDFNNDITDPRYRCVYFLCLIENLDEYNLNKAENTEAYKKLSSFLWSVRDCRRSAWILHELKMLGIEGVSGIDYPENDINETNRIWHLLLKKAYWRD